MDDTAFILFGLPVSLNATVVVPLSPSNDNTLTDEGGTMLQTDDGSSFILTSSVVAHLANTLTFDDGTALIDGTGAAFTLDNSMLTVEDGTIVAGANTYASVATVRTYGAVNGVDGKLPVSDDDVAQVILNAMSWLEAKETQFKGVRYTQAYSIIDANGIRVQQQLSWPRVAAYIFGFASNMTVPSQLVNALCQLTCDITYGYEPFPNAVASQNNLQRSTIGPITKVYFNPNTISGSPTQYFPKVTAILTPLLKNTGVRSVRI